MEDWAQGSFCPTDQNQAQVLNAIAIGRAQALDDITTRLDFEVIREFYSKESS